MLILSSNWDLRVWLNKENSQNLDLDLIFEGAPVMLRAKENWRETKIVDVVKQL